MELIGLGKADELRMILNGAKSTNSLTFPGFFWAWDGSPTDGFIRLVKAEGPDDLALSYSSDVIHTKFHGKSPTSSMQVYAEPLKKPRAIGLATAIAYDARRFSSSKADAIYRHFFGAVTEDDKPPFASALLPAVVVDAKGQVALVRRPGNTFTLEDWIVG